jgi:hypothetical protein
MIKITKIKTHQVTTEPNPAITQREDLYVPDDLYGKRREIAEFISDAYDFGDIIEISGHSDNHVVNFTSQKNGEATKVKATIDLDE